MKLGKYTEALAFLDKITFKDPTVWTLYQQRIICEGILNRGTLDTRL